MGLDHFLGRGAVALELDIEAIAEDGGEPVEAGGGKIALPGGDRPVDRAARPAGERDQACGLRRQAVDGDVGRTPGSVSMKESETRRTRFQ